MGKLAGKVALITGASRGIGQAIAETYGREGAKVIVNYTSDSAAAGSVVKTIQASGGEAVAVQADVTDPTSLRALFAKTEEVFGGLDILVANAHPGLGRGLLTEVSEDVVDQQLAVLKSYVLTLQEAGRRIRDGGVIITITSAAARVAFPEVVIYGSVKLAIEQLSRGLSRELAPRGVRVVPLSPGLTRTERGAGAPPPPAVAQNASAFSGRAEPEDIADAALFLASNDARWVNTATLFVNGGSVYAQ